MKEQELPLTRNVDVHRVGDKGLAEKLTLTEAERKAVISTYGLLDLPEFSVDFDLKPWRRNGVIVQGRMVATAVQPCVATLEPVEQQIDAPFEVFFQSEESGGRKSAAADALEIDIDFEGDDPPEVIENGQIDLGAVALEQFALALDPYPRAATASEAYPVEKEESETGGDAKRPSPFAVLSRLKEKPDEGDGTPEA